MGNCYGKKCNRIFVKEEDNSLDNIGSYDPDLYDIVKDIRNNCILSEVQIKYIKSISRKDIIKIIKLLNFCNYVNVQSFTNLYDKESAQKEKEKEERRSIELREHQYIICNQTEILEKINIISQQMND